MFKFTLNQNNFHPEGNNYCGGFALAAALNLTNQFHQNTPDPMIVYQQIQREQNDLEPDVKGLVEFSKVDGNGTAICLPSSIARVAQRYGQRPVIYHDLRLSGALAKIIASEQKRYGQVRFNPCSSLNETLAKLPQHNCFIVLMGNHWLSISRDKDGKIRGYDPAARFANGRIEISENTVTAYPNEYAGVVIGF